MTFGFLESLFWGEVSVIQPVAYCTGFALGSYFISEEALKGLVDVGPYARLGLSAAIVSSAYILYQHTAPASQPAKGQQPQSPYLSGAARMARTIRSNNARAKVGTTATGIPYYSTPFIGDLTYYAGNYNY